jgi:hypothetical protein
MAYFEPQGPGLERQRKAGGEAALTVNVRWRIAGSQLGSYVSPVAFAVCTSLHGSLTTQGMRLLPEPKKNLGSVKPCQGRAERTSRSSARALLTSPRATAATRWLTKRTPGLVGAFGEAPLIGARGCKASRHVLMTREASAFWQRSLHEIRHPSPRTRVRSVATNLYGSILCNLP